MNRSTSTVPTATRRAKQRLGLLFVAPGAVLVLGLFVVPLGRAFYLSLHDYDGVSAHSPFIGLRNYRRLFTDPLVGDALLRNLAWVLVGTVAPLLLGLVMALTIWTVGRSSILYRVLFFIPHLLPVVAIGVVWGWIYNPLSGWANRALELVGLDNLTRGWLGDPGTAFWSILVTAVWATYGFVVLVLLAALGNVNQELIEAARLDGATIVQRVWHVILPQIMTVFLLVTTLTLVGGFSVFDIVFVMTGGGPSNASNVLGTYAYTNAFQLGDIDYGITLALYILVLSVPFVVALNLLQRRLALRELR